MYRWFLVLLFMFVAGKGFGLQATWSYNIFYLPDGNGKLAPYAEMYWSINPNTLQYTVGTDNKWQGKIRTDILLSNDSGLIKEDHYILQTVPSAGLVLASKQNIADLQRYTLPVGNIKVSLTLTDLADTSNKAIIEKKITVAPPSEKSFYSGLQIIDTSFESKEQNIYIKNGTYQIPLSAAFVDDSRNVLRYYTEFYNLSGYKAPLVQKVYISKKENDGGAIYRLFKSDTLKRVPNIVPILAAMDISVLPSGNYYLNVQMEDTSGEKLAERAMFFQRSNSNPSKLEELEFTTDSLGGGMQSVQVFDLSKTFVIQYSPAQIKAIMKMMLPISTPMEREVINGFLKKPDEMYMRYFIYNFWLGKNKLAPEKEWEQYTEKVKFTNREFAAPGKPGYETDRGRVFLKYGRPDERIEMRNESGTLPYEIWMYNILGKQTGALFMFYQSPSMINDYELLHTNVNGEIRNMQWRTLLYTSQQSFGNNNIRAEQYFPQGR